MVKETLKGVAQDSRKHANLYNGILSLLKDKNRLITEQDYDQIKSILEEHIKVEMRMVNKIKNLLDTEQDS